MGGDAISMATPTATGSVEVKHRQDGFRIAARKKLGQLSLEEKVGHASASSVLVKSGQCVCGELTEQIIGVSPLRCRFLEN